MKKRHNQPVSFNLTNKYEDELLKFALEQDKYFSKYVKRLIEQDRGRQQQVQTHQPASPVVNQKRESEDTMNAFL